MEKEEKAFLYSVKASIKRGELPKPATIKKLIDLIENQRRANEILKSNWQGEIRDNEKMKKHLQEIKEKVMKKIDEAFMHMGT